LTDEYAWGTMGADQKLTALSQLCILMPLFAPAKSIAAEQAPAPEKASEAVPLSISVSLSLSLSLFLRENEINPTLAVNLGPVIRVSLAVSRSRPITGTCRFTSRMHK